MGDGFIGSSTFHVFYAEYPLKWELTDGATNVLNHMELLKNVIQKHIKWVTDSLDQVLFMLSMQNIR
jgi:hypothetical protein